MNFLTAACTDVGIRKKTNQDSLCLKVAKTNIGTLLLAVICDGMGGLMKGELASATVIKAFSDWFENQLPQMVDNLSLDDVQYQWTRIVREQNYKIAEYGKQLNTQLGTTLTALLLIDSHKFIIVHVGDSRAYRIKDTLEILTEDQTVVAREIRRGTLTPEQAEVDPRRNVLLQCIGASRTVVPDFVFGTIDHDCTYMLCSDGFRHQITEQEMFNHLHPQVLLNEGVMEQKAVELVELNKDRMENDNITVLLIKSDVA